MVGKTFRPGVVAAVMSLTACGTSNTSAGLPGPVSSVVPATSIVDTGSVMPSSSRALPAFPVDCSQANSTSNTNTTGQDPNGSCEHIQLASVSYGPTTPASMVAGYHPADLQAAYALPSATGGANQTIAIVVGGDDPNAESDLGVYRSTFGLPACTSANGCFSKSDLSNGNADTNWAAEAAIDLDMASAICPKCKLLLVEAKSSKMSDLSAAVSVAVANGASVVNNSYAIPETKSLKDSDWNHPGVAIVAATGDTGYQAVANWPAASSHVIAVGGTTLAHAANARGWTETAWNRSGSACSSVASKPLWQHDAGCANRTVADIAAVADPATPVAVYDTYNNAGWVQMAGTSVAAPIVAGAYALAGNAKSISGAASIYANSASLFPVTVGINGVCSVRYLCVAGAGYNGPTGLGSPNGIGAL